jgi:hypothetical protein
MRKRKFEDNIKMDIKTACEGVDWTNLAQDRDQWQDVVNKVMNFQIP